VIAAVAVMAFAGTAFGNSLRGTVVHRNKHAHSFVVAKRSGQLVSVHARRSPALGRHVVVRGRYLHNGTFGARHITGGALSRKAHIRGVVTFVDKAHGRFVVSAKGVSLVVHQRSARMLAAAALPAVGDVVTVDGEIDDQGDIDADNVENDGQNNDYADLEGQILSIDLTARTLTITADDNDEIAGASIVVHIPDTWDMSIYAVGDELDIVASLNTDGSYTAVGTSENGDFQQADDENGQQGDDQGDQGGD